MGNSPNRKHNQQQSHLERSSSLFENRYQQNKKTSNQRHSISHVKRGQAQLQTPEKIKNPHKRNSLLHTPQLFNYSQRLDNDPSDREYVVACPRCKMENFDNGLNQRIKCFNCKTQYDSESKKMWSTSKKKVRKSQTSKSKKPKQLDLGDDDDDDEEELEVDFQYEPVLDFSPFDENLFQGTIEDQKKQENLFQEGKKTTSFPIFETKNQSLNDQANDSSKSQKNIDFDQVEENIIKFPKKRKQIRISQGYKEDNSNQWDEDEEDDLDDQEEESKQARLDDMDEIETNSNNQDDDDYDEQDENDSDEEEQEVKEVLNDNEALLKKWNKLRAKQAPNIKKSVQVRHLQLFCNKKTLIADFMTEKGEAKSNLIIEKLLIPFFQIKSRVVSKGSFFNIGDIQFYVANCIPQNGGKVSSLTTLHPPQVYDFDQRLEKIKLITVKRLHQHKTYLVQNVLLPFFKHNSLLAYQQEVFVIDGGEYYIRYANPKFGLIDSKTEIKIESSNLREVKTVNILPIWKNARQQTELINQANKLRCRYQQIIMQEFIIPFFLESGQLRYIERGDKYKIGDLELYVNGCHPKNGVVSKLTIIDIDSGISRSKFESKIMIADQRIAQQLQHIQDFQRPFNLSHSNSLNNSQSGAANNVPRGLNSSVRRLLQREFAFRRHASEVDEQQKQEAHSPSHRHLIRSSLRNAGSRVQAISERLDSIHHLINRIRQQHRSQLLQNEEVFKGMPRGKVVQFPTRVAGRAYLDAQRENFIQLKERGQSLEYELMQQNPNLTCMICLQEYKEGDEIRTLPCIHCFHEKCIDDWLERATTCPLCKLDLMADLDNFE